MAKLNAGVPPLVAALLWTVAAAVPDHSAAAAASNDIEACRRVADERARLACYDLALPPRRGTATPNSLQAREAAPVHSMPAANLAPTAGQVTAPAATSTPMPGAALLPSQTTTIAAPDFGLPQRPLFDRTEALESAVVGAFDGWGPDEQFKLSNGQVWQISDGSSAGYTLRDPKVRITRGSFGTFFMHIEGVSQTPKVRRLR